MSSREENREFGISRYVRGERTMLDGAHDSCANVLEFVLDDLGYILTTSSTGARGARSST